MSAPTPKAPKAKQIPAAEVRVGQHLTGQVKYDEHGAPIVKAFRRPVEVKTLDPCPGAKRTHVHVNGHECYDGRLLVEVR